MFVESSWSPKGERNNSNRVPSKRYNPRGVPSQRNPSLVCAKATVPCGALSLNPQKSWPISSFAEGCVCATTRSSGHGICTNRRTSPRKYALELLANRHEKNEVMGNFG